MERRHFHKASLQMVSNAALKSTKFQWSAIRLSSERLPHNKYSICRTTGLPKATLLFSQIVVNGDLNSAQDYPDEYFPWYGEKGDCSVIAWIEFVSLLENWGNEAFAPVFRRFSLCPCHVDDF